MTSSLSELCQRHGLNAEQIARRSGLDEGRVAAILLGRWTPSPVERQRISAVFGLSPEQICWGHRTPVQHLDGHGQADGANCARPTLAVAG